MKGGHLKEAAPMVTEARIASIGVGSNSEAPLLQLVLRG
jgi:hypothetical protein